VARFSGYAPFRVGLPVLEQEGVEGGAVCPCFGPTFLAPGGSPAHRRDSTSTHEAGLLDSLLCRLCLEAEQQEPTQNDAEPVLCEALTALDQQREEQYQSHMHLAWSSGNWTLRHVDSDWSNHLDIEQDLRLSGDGQGLADFALQEAGDPVWARVMLARLDPHLAVHRLDNAAVTAALANRWARLDPDLDADARGLAMLGHGDLRWDLKPARSCEPAGGADELGDDSSSQEPAVAPKPIATSAPVAQPPPWPEDEPQSFEDCLARLAAAKKRIATHGYQPKYSDAELAAQARQATGPLPDRYIVNFKNGSYDPTKALGTPAPNGKVRYWSTTFDQIEDADTDAELLAAKLGIPPEDIKPEDGFSLAIIDTHHPDMAGGETVVPTFDNLSKVVKAEYGLNTIDPKLVDQVMTPAYVAEYRALDAGYAPFCKEAGTQAWDPEAGVAYADASGMTGSTRDRFLARKAINRDFGANAKFKGDGTTEHLEMGEDPAPQSRGCVETFTLHRDPPPIGKTGVATIVKL
jgi:hypothetical protein